MLISYNWLRELTSTTSPPEELRERLTMVGLAIDSVDESKEDSILDVEVPSNRPDCLSHIGIAREVSVIERSQVHNPKSTAPKVEGKTSDFASVEINDTDLCPRYAARVIRGVTIAPSPEWLAKRLAEIGQRPINNVADITNYVLHELGQPLHAFDLAKLSEHRIIVRPAKENEKLRTLDGVERTLDPRMLVIADAESPVALAGIMGGEHSEISNTTTDVLIESAYFDPDSVRQTARQLGMDTEASRRFERGADCENVLKAQSRCVELICEIAGGVATADAIDVYPHPMPPRLVEIRPSSVESVTSLRVDLSEATRILMGLGFTLEQSKKDDVFVFAVPSWRVDVSLEEDLVEEVARHVGYDNIASELPPSNISGEYQPTEMKRRALRRVLKDSGFDEAINFSFIDTSHDDQFAAIPAMLGESHKVNPVTLANPILEEATRMRFTLLPGLLESIRHNMNQGIRDLRLFEIGRVFAKLDDAELPIERDALALIATGGALEEDYAQAPRAIDFYELKGALESAVDAMKLGPMGFSRGWVIHLRQGQSAKIALADNTEIGSIGRLSEPIAASYKFRQPVYLAELDLSALLESEERLTQYRPLPRYPSVVRDVTLVLDRGVTFAELVDAVESERLAYYSRTKLVGTYEGQSIPEDKRSVTLRIEYRSNEGTLRDDEVEERHRELIDSLLKKFSAELH